MHSAIIVIEEPDRPTPKSWQEFLSETAPELQRVGGATRLGEGVWLVNFQQSPAALAILVSAAERCGFRSGILPLRDEPQWLPAGFDPRPI